MGAWITIINIKMAHYAYAYAPMRLCYANNRVAAANSLLTLSPSKSQI